MPLFQQNAAARVASSIDKLAELCFGNRQTVLFFCLAVLTVLCLLVRYIVVLDEHNQHAHLRQHVLAQASDLRTRIEQEINTTLNLTLGSLVYVASHPDITQEEFSRFAREIMQRAPYIQNLGLAKDNVISHIYPLHGNEKALGLRYLDNPQQRDAVLRAIKTHTTVIAGPIELVQGGQGFISRIPIFLDESGDHYWGMSSIVVKTEPFYTKVGLDRARAVLNTALRGSDAQGAQGGVFYGDAALFTDPTTILLTIPLPEGSWVLAAQPRDGWTTERGRSHRMYAVGLVISLLIAALLYSLLLKNLALKAEQRKVTLASEHKNRFFTHMTHELRTPLTAVYGSIRLLNSGKVRTDSPPWKELCNNAERNCQRLMWLINDVLDLKRLESGKLEYHLAEESLLEIAKGALDEVQQYAKQFTISVELHDRLPETAIVYADRKRMQQVLVNLLSNAIKFSPAHGNVELILTRSESAVRVEVKDCGPGIPREIFATIFNEFVQAEQAGETARKTSPGTGLGLSISKQLVLDQGGSIGCYNQEHAGAVFYVTLPLAKVIERPPNHRDKIAV